MISRDFIGLTSEPRTIAVETRQLKFFAKATGQTDPVYFDERAALAAGHPALPVPPTYVLSLAAGVPAKVGDFQTFGVDLGRVLHGEQGFTHHRMIYAGDRITFVTKTTDIYEKKGGALEFIVQDTTATNHRGELCTEMRTVIVVRNG